MKKDVPNEHDSSRRAFFRKSAALIPLTALAVQTPAMILAEPAVAAEPAKPYAPTFFNANEWAFIQAACDKLIPADDVGPGALELGVPEFIDRHMQTPYAQGDIWYLQGPFIEAGKEFGYQGKLPPKEILRVGIKAVDDHCRKAYDNKTFAQLDAKTQVAELKALEGGKTELDGVPAKVFFTHLHNETLYGYFGDPKYGGNKGMGSWKMIGYPGARADYLDWVEQTDKPYPLPPVSINGERG